MHPSGNYLYNSNSDLITTIQPAIEVFDISDPAHPARRRAGLPTRPGLGTESHDITFNADGSRAYSAALSQGVIIDTTDPAAPSIVTSFVDPTINVWHQADPVQIGDRKFLIVEDEFAGAPAPASARTAACTSTTSRRDQPVKVGYWNIDTVATDHRRARRPLHRARLPHPRAAGMTIAYYNGGVRVVDLSGLEGIALGGVQSPGGHARGRLLPASPTATHGRSRRRGSRLTATSTSTATTSPRPRRLPLHPSAANPEQAPAAG